MVPRADNSTVDRGVEPIVDPGALVLFFQYCQDIQTTTRNISTALQGHDVDNGLINSITQASGQMWEVLQDIPPRLLPLVIEEIRQYRETLIQLHGAIELNLLPLGHSSICHISGRLENIVRDFQRKLDGIRPRGRHKASGGGPSFFKNSSHITIYGGAFTATTATSDPVLHAQNEKIMRMQYIHLGILFVYTGHSEWQQKFSS